MCIVIILASATPLAIYTVNAQENYFAGAWPYDVPPKGHFNVFATGAILGPGSIYYDLIQMPLGMYIWYNQTWVKLLATDWSIDMTNRVFVIRLRSDARWSDGSPFTSKDVKCTWLIQYARGHIVFRYVDPLRIETPDDYTVIFHIVSNVSPIILERYIIRQNVADYKTYGEYCDKVEDLLKQGKDFRSKEMQDLVQDLTQNYRPPEMLATGPYKIDLASITESELWLVKNPYSPFAKDVKFDKIRIYNGETPAITPLVLAKLVDYATHAFPVATEKQFIEMGVKILRPPTYTGPALYFNYNHSKYGELFRMKEFRQAIAYAINRSEAAIVSLGLSARPVKYMTGTSDALTVAWMRKEDLNKLETYEYNPSKAEELLKSIGLTKSGGLWYWKGEPVELELSFPAEYADWAATAENVAKQLEAFGFKVVLRAVTYTQHPVEVREGRFMMAIRTWGSAFPHPFASYNAIFSAFNALMYLGAGSPGMALSMIWNTKYGEVNATDLIIRMGTAIDLEEQKSLFTQLALVFNDFLPIIPLWERLGNNPVLDGIRVCGWLPFDDPLYQNAVYGDNFVVIMILKGILYPCGMPGPSPTTTTSPTLTTSPSTPTSAPTPTPAAATVTVTSTITSVLTSITTTTQTMTEWTTTTIIAVVALIIGFAIGYFTKRR